MQYDEDSFTCHDDSNNSLYYLEALAESSRDYQLIEKSFNNTGKTFLNMSKRSELIIEKVYRIRSRRPKKVINSSKILVFHGTPRKNVPGILTSGFKSSETGRFGPGVYHSNFVGKSLLYSSFSSFFPPFLGGNEDFFIFVNELPIKYLYEKSVEESPETYCRKYLCTDDEQPEVYERDSDGSFINVAIERNYDHPEFVASSNIVVPKYFVHAKEVETKLVKRLNNVVILLYDAVDFYDKSP